MFLENVDTKVSDGEYRHLIFFQKKPWIYISFSADHSLKKTGLENLKESPYLCILWFWILITAPINYTRF